MIALASGTDLDLGWPYVLVRNSFYFEWGEAFVYALGRLAGLRLDIQLEMPISD